MNNKLDITEINEIYEQIMDRSKEKEYLKWKEQLCLKGEYED